VLKTNQKTFRVEATYTFEGREMKTNYVVRAANLWEAQPLAKETFKEKHLPTVTLDEITVYEIQV